MGLLDQFLIDLNEEIVDLNYEIGKYNEPSDQNDFRKSESE